MVSSSMPVRDVEWFGPPRSDVSVFSNRGANGIDGVVATAVGVAITGVPTVCLIGDVALLHDASSLSGLRSRNIDLTIVVIDNDGGGIFSFLPQRDLLPLATYERALRYASRHRLLVRCAQPTGSSPPNSDPMSTSPRAGSMS